MQEKFIQANDFLLRKWRRTAFLRWQAFKTCLSYLANGEEIMKTLVVYYSRTGNTQFVAETVAQHLGADIEEVVDLKKRFGMSAFMKASLDAMLGRETKISATAKSPELYDLIVVGTPVWFTRPTPAIRTYLKKNSLAGKRVAIFCTNEGNGGEKAIEKTKELLPESNPAVDLIIVRLRENKEDAENKISEWCGKLKVPLELNTLAR